MLLRTLFNSALYALLLISPNARVRAQDALGAWQQTDGKRITISAANGGGVTLTTPEGVALSGQLTGRQLTVSYVYRNGANNPAFLADLPEAVRAQLARDGRGFSYSGTVSANGDSIRGSYSFPRHNNREVVGWLDRPQMLTRVFTAERQLTLDMPGGLQWAQEEQGELKACVDGVPESEAVPALQIRVAKPESGSGTLRREEPEPCIVYRLLPDPEQEGTYQLIDADNFMIERWPEGGYVLNVTARSADPSIRYRSPQQRQLFLHPPTRIEIIDKNTGELLIGKEDQNKVARVVLSQQLTVRVIGSPYRDLTPDNVRITVTSSKDNLTHDLERRESGGIGLAIWEHRGDFIFANTANTRSSFNDIAVEPEGGDTLTVSSGGRSVKLRVRESRNWQTAEMLGNQLRDLKDLYGALLQNPNLTQAQRGELITKEALASRAVAFHDRGDVVSYFLITASKAYFELLRMNRAQLGANVGNRVMDPALLPEDMRDTPVPVPWALEAQYMLAAKREAGNMLGREVNAATLASISVLVKLPMSVLDAPNQISEQINVILTGRKLDGEWASSDDKLMAAIDLGQLAFGPLVRGMQALRPTRAARRVLVETDHFRVAKRAQDALDMPNMSAVRAQRIIQAHEVGRPPYSWTDLSRKMDILTGPPPRGAGLTRAQADLLMRQGITGFAEPRAATRLPAADRQKFRNLVTKDATKLTLKEAEDLYDLRRRQGIVDDPDPATPEHKAKRWNDYKNNPESEGWQYDRWSQTYDRNMDNWKRGLRDQENSLNELKITNNDRAGQRLTFSNGTDQTRPDGVTSKAVVDCKSMSTTSAVSERVLNMDDQLRLQRQAAKGQLTCTPPGCVPAQSRKFAVVMSSDNELLVRPSRNLANPDIGADVVYHRNTRNGHWSEWRADPTSPGGGAWHDVTDGAAGVARVLGDSP